MTSNWFYAHGGKQFGPVTLEELRRQVASRQLGAHDLVWTEGWPEWVEARSVTELSGAWPQAPAAAPAPPYPQQPSAQGPLPMAHVAYYAHPQGPAPPNYLVHAILVTIFCCLPFGIVSIVFAAQVNSKHQAGDIAGAIDASNKAKTWAWVSFWLGAIPVALWGIFVVLAAIGGAMGR